MAGDTADTKQRLLIAAGELFAEHGIEGASLREITRRAGANVAAVSYHFGSKEKLYTAVLRYVIEVEGAGRPSLFLPKLKARSTQQDCSNVLHRIISARFARYFSPDLPLWCSRLMMRSLLDPSPSLKEVVKQVLRPDHVALVEIIRRSNRRLTRKQAQLSAFSLVGQIAFYVFARPAVLMLLDRKQYDPVFVQDAARHVSSIMARSLGLPEPKG